MTQKAQRNGALASAPAGQARVPPPVRQDRNIHLITLGGETPPSQPARTPALLSPHVEPAGAVLLMIVSRNRDEVLKHHIV